MSLVPKSFLRKQLYESLQKLHYGSLELTTPEGETWCFKGQAPGPAAHAHLYDWQAMERIHRRRIDSREPGERLRWHFPPRAAWLRRFRDLAPPPSFVRGGRGKL